MNKIKEEELDNMISECEVSITQIKENYPDQEDIIKALEVNLNTLNIMKKFLYGLPTDNK